MTYEEARDIIPMVEAQYNMIVMLIRIAPRGRSSKKHMQNGVKISFGDTSNAILGG